MYNHCCKRVILRSANVSWRGFLLTLLLTGPALASPRHPTPTQLKDIRALEDAHGACAYRTDPEIVKELRVRPDYCQNWRHKVSVSTATVWSAGLGARSKSTRAATTVRYFGHGDWVCGHFAIMAAKASRIAAIDVSPNAEACEDGVVRIDIFPSPRACTQLVAFGPNWVPCMIAACISGGSDPIPPLTRLAAVPARLWPPARSSRHRH